MQGVQSSNKSYQRTAGSTGAEGQNYETKMTAFMLLRLYNTSQDFILANNFRHGEKFDDLVFVRFTGNVWEPWFIQLKHKEDINKRDSQISISSLQSKRKNQDFYLLKYVLSYYQICSRFNNSKPHESSYEIFKHSFENTQFAIFTNSKVTHEIRRKNIEHIPHDLSTNTKDQLVFRFNKEDKLGVFSGCRPEDAFFNKFWMFTEQASQWELDEIIENELRVTGITDPVALKFTRLGMYERLQSWYKESTYLTKNDFNNYLTELSLSGYRPTAEQLVLRFQDGFIRSFYANLKGALDNSNIVAVMAKGSSLLVNSAAKQLFSQFTIREINLVGLAENCKKVIQQWHDSSAWYLIVYCDTCPPNLNPTILASDIKILMQNCGTNKAIIFLVPSVNAMATDLVNEVSAKKFSFSCTLNNLDDCVKTQLTEQSIMFQGYSLTIGSLFSGSKTMADMFNTAMLDQLFSGEIVKVGLKPVEKIEYYVDRVLTMDVGIAEEMFTSDESTPDLIAVSGVDLKKMKLITHPSKIILEAKNVLQGPGGALPQCDIIILTPSLEESQLVALSKLRNNVHWISKSKKHFRWMKSSQEVVTPFLLKYIRNSQLNYVTTANIMEIDNKIVLLTAEPGMGKSTLLAHLAATTKHLCPNIWVLYVALNDYTSWFEKTNFKGAFEADAQNLLLEAAGASLLSTSKFDKRLFEECYNNSGNMIVLLDGFDEVSSFYEAQVLKFLRILRKSKVQKIWISTRPIKKDLLEKELNTISYNIMPFAEKDQERFFSKYWKVKYPKIEDVYLNIFVTKLIQISRSFDTDGAQFTGIPLQTRMLSEVFDDTMSDYYSSNYQLLNLPDKVNILQLFDKFVELKFKILVSEKSKIDVSNVNAKHQQEYLNKYRRIALRKLALLCLFQESDLSLISPKITKEEIQELRENEMSGKETTGIVQNFVNNIPQFIHRTFAEYFVAEFFCWNLAENKQILEKFLFTPPFAMVKYMFDRMLTTHQVFHNLVLENNMASIKVYLKEPAAKTKYLTEKDKGGRTPLHVAVGIDAHHDLIDALLAAGADPKGTDDVIEWHPICYADKLESATNVGVLLEYWSEAKQYLKHIKAFALESGNGWVLVRHCLKNDFLNFYKYLIEDLAIDVTCPFGADFVLIPMDWLMKMEVSILNHSMNKSTNKLALNLTTCHVAAYYGSLKIMKYLFESIPRQYRSHIIKALVSCKDGLNKTPLHYAVESGNLDVIRILLDNGSDISVKDESNQSPLNIGVQLNNHDVVDLFIDHAKTSLTSRERIELFTEQLLTCFKSEDSLQLAELIFTKGVPETRSNPTELNYWLVTALMSKNCKGVTFLLNNGAGVNQLVLSGYTPLHLASKLNDLESAKVLLQFGAEINAQDPSGLTPLHIAVCMSSEELVLLYLENQADVRIRTTIGDSVLHLAVASEASQEVFKELVVRGADINAVNNAGKRIFDNAEEDLEEESSENEVELECDEQQIITCDDDIKDDSFDNLVEADCANLSLSNLTLEDQKEVVLNQQETQLLDLYSSNSSINTKNRNLFDQDKVSRNVEQQIQFHDVKDCEFSVEGSTSLAYPVLESKHVHMEHNSRFTIIEGNAKQNTPEQKKVNPEITEDLGDNKGVTPQKIKSVKSRSRKKSNANVQDQGGNKSNVSKHTENISNGAISKENSTQARPISNNDKENIERKKLNKKSKKVDIQTKPNEKNSINIKAEEVNATSDSQKAIASSSQEPQKDEVTIIETGRANNNGKKIGKQSKPKPKATNIGKESNISNLTNLTCDPQENTSDSQKAIASSSQEPKKDEVTIIETGKANNNGKKIEKQSKPKPKATNIGKESNISNLTNLTCDPQENTSDSQKAIASSAQEPQRGEVKVIESGRKIEKQSKPKPKKANISKESSISNLPSLATCNVHENTSDLRKAIAQEPQIDEVTLVETGRANNDGEKIEKKSNPKPKTTNIGEESNISDLLNWRTVSLQDSQKQLPISKPQPNEGSVKMPKKAHNQGKPTPPKKQNSSKGQVTTNEHKNRQAVNESGPALQSNTRKQSVGGSEENQKAPPMTSQQKKPKRTKAATQNKNSVPAEKVLQNKVKQQQAKKKQKVEKAQLTQLYSQLVRISAELASIKSSTSVKATA